MPFSERLGRSSNPIRPAGMGPRTVDASSAPHLFSVPEQSVVRPLVGGSKVEGQGRVEQWIAVARTIYIPSRFREQNAVQQSEICEQFHRLAMRELSSPELRENPGGFDEFRFLE